MPITKEQIEELRERMPQISAVVKAMAAVGIGLAETSDEIEDINVCVMIGINRQLSVGSTCSPAQTLEMCRALVRSIEDGETVRQH